MAQPIMNVDSLRRELDATITADGDPYADAVAVIAHTLELAFVEANGGMGKAEFDSLQRVARDFKRHCSEVTISGMELQ